ncbi:hypothetical protein CGRA01v4_10768 [Colletotrichum graminicola]|uniref:Uncharacterized protein n=1 Tax=Colletotrichum graminicola (strain M1.001 / M2 / FGSC 10212) TaxID=645133 RepID=E3QSN4_COLGM|nr:uncharacterized protein GLRG_09016 [Colletotrichum graminicola M1.001]EFQ33872.1 hypothetical protein GLRG_09016 [Colletotrichum graminicola M1.001]WDK19481.1 hypothetical protein CGRA01v4_10768 [Colletotrichum graminicola]
MAPPPSQLMMPPVPGTDRGLLNFGATSSLSRANDTGSFSSAFSSSDSDDDSTAPILGSHRAALGYQAMNHGGQQGAATAAAAAAGEQSRGGSLKDRACPNMRGCWSFSWEAYSLNTADKAVLFRRVCMYITLGARTAMSVIGVVGDIAHGRVLGAVLGVILGAIGFLFIAWCLAVIGQAEGRRKVLGVMVGRLHFDLFLLAAAFIHTALLVGSFVGLGTSGGQATWLIMWLLIFLVAWIGTWPACQESYL